MGGPITKEHRSAALAKRKQLVLATAVDRGGCEWAGCTRPGYSWHHVDSSTKSFAMIRAINNKGLISLSRELAKCKWLCHGHHHMAEAHLELGLPIVWKSLP